MPKKSRPGSGRRPRLAGGLGTAGLAALGAFGCAHVAAPPGGPADSIPPVLIAVQPDSYAVVADFEDDVRFEFDESISERNIQGSVTLYPFEARPRVKKGKRELKVRPRAGWIAPRIYHVRVEPVIQDLFGNRIEAPIHYVFSTGMPVPGNRVQGVVFDRITDRPLPAGRVDFIQLADTLRYGTVADSAGGFAINTFPTGDYLAIGFDDVNNNLRADDFDRSDTLELSLGAVDTLTLVFKVFRHDSLGPRLTQVEPVDTLTLELRFDGYLDPDSALRARDAELFALADSTPLPLDTVLHGWQYTAWRDSLGRARAAAADTLELEAPAAEPPEAEAAALPAAAIPERELGEPGEQVTPEEPQRLPARRIYVVARARIPPGTHVVRVRRIINLSGLVGGGELSFEPLVPPERDEPPEPPG